MSEIVADQLTATWKKRFRFKAEKYSRRLGRALLQYSKRETSLSSSRAPPQPALSLITVGIKTNTPFLGDILLRHRGTTMSQYGKIAGTLNKNNNNKYYSSQSQSSSSSASQKAGRTGSSIHTSSSGGSYLPNKLEFPRTSRTSPSRTSPSRTSPSRTNPSHVQHQELSSRQPLDARHTSMARPPPSPSSTKKLSRSEVPKLPSASKGPSTALSKSVLKNSRESRMKDTLDYTGTSSQRQKHKDYLASAGTSSSTQHHRRSKSTDRRPDVQQSKNKALSTKTSLAPTGTPTLPKYATTTHSSLIAAPPYFDPSSGKYAGLFSESENSSKSSKVSQRSTLERKGSGHSPSPAAKFGGSLVDISSSRQRRLEDKRTSAKNIPELPSVDNASLKKSKASSVADCLNQTESSLYNNSRTTRHSRDSDYSLNQSHFGYHNSGSSSIATVSTTSIHPQATRNSDNLNERRTSGHPPSSNLSTFEKFTHFPESNNRSSIHSPPAPKISDYTVAGYADYQAPSRSNTPIGSDAATTTSTDAQLTVKMESKRKLSPKSMISSVLRIIRRGKKGGNQSTQISLDEVEAAYLNGGIRGIANLGNTCYMNSMVQCLSHTLELTDVILCGNFTLGNISSEYHKALKKLWLDNRDSKTGRPGPFLSPTHQQKEVVRLKEFKQVLSDRHRQYSGYSQHDAQEFFSYLIGTIHNELKPAKPKSVVSDCPAGASDFDLGNHRWEVYFAKEGSPIAEIFVGQFKSTILCTYCKYTSSCFDPFWDIGLPLCRPHAGLGVGRSTPHLKDCFSLFCKDETLDGENRPVCDRCNKPQKSIKKMTIRRFPPVLVLYLKRFNEYRKLDSVVTIPKHIDLSEFASPEIRKFLESNEVGYDLFAVSNHSGSMAAGHYTADVKHLASQKWFHCNDHRVSVSKTFSGSEFDSVEAYILFYRQSTA